MSWLCLDADCEMQFMMTVGNHRFEGYSDWRLMISISMKLKNAYELQSQREVYVRHNETRNWHAKHFLWSSHFDASKDAHYNFHFASTFSLAKFSANLKTQIQTWGTGCNRFSQEFDICRFKSKVTWSCSRCCFSLISHSKDDTIRKNVLKYEKKVWCWRHSSFFTFHLS